MECGKEDSCCLLISEVYETRIDFPARRHGLVFGFGITTEKVGADGNQSEGHALVPGYRPIYAAAISDGVVCACSPWGGCCVPSFIGFSVTDFPSPAQPAK